MTGHETFDCSLLQTSAAIDCTVHACCICCMAINTALAANCCQVAWLLHCQQDMWAWLFLGQELVWLLMQGTPLLHIAAKANHADIVTALVSHGADKVSTCCMFFPAQHVCQHHLGPCPRRVNPQMQHCQTRNALTSPHVVLQSWCS